MKKCTNNFSETNNIGSDGYGKVQFCVICCYTLLCIEGLFPVDNWLPLKELSKGLRRGEQMLVYEYITNGTLKKSHNGKSGIRLDWMRRLRIALGAARGVHYLHEQANPPIIHRDIKSNNILLDDRLNAKEADFGMEKKGTDKPPATQRKSWSPHFGAFRWLLESGVGWNRLLESWGFRRSPQFSDQRCFI
ncbi:hypothetical protein ACS0TY_014411 [Phlomoides rotata]